MTAADVLLSAPPKKFADPPGRTSPTMQQLELAQLQQRGLTKSLFNHFTKECKKVDAELAAAEAAFVELEARKAKASEFSPDSPQIEQLDAVCKTVAEWRKHCRNKEQETVLLYGKYCEKFGGSIEVAKPEEFFKSSRSGSVASIASALANTDIATLVQSFKKAKNEPHGIPSFLLPKEASTPSSFNNKELEEILEDSSLQDNEAPRVLPATPRTEVTGDNADDSSIVSGLTTLNSATTREVLHDVENKVLDFIKNETENIRKMMEEDAISKAGGLESCSVGAGSKAASQAESQSVADHEKMVFKMQQVLEAFKKAEEETKMKEEKGATARRVPGGNVGEEWYEHFDNTYQRHYYVEKHTNKTQWHSPTRTDVSVADYSLSVSMNSGSTVPARAANPTVADMAMAQDFIPDASMRSLGGRRRGRVEAYRAKVRKQRKRQLAVMGIVLAVLGAGALYYRYNNPEQVEQAMETVARVIGMDENSAHIEDVQVKSRNTKKKKETKKETRSTTPTPASSSTQSLPVPSTRKAKAPTTSSSTTTSAKPTKKEVPAPPPTKTKKTPSPVKTVAKKKASEVPDTPGGEDIGLAPFQPESQHWIMDVLKGPLAFKTVNYQCMDNERYCGLHHY